MSINNVELLRTKKTDVRSNITRAVFFTTPNKYLHYITWWDSRGYRSYFNISTQVLTHQISYLQLVWMMRKLYLCVEKEITSCTSLLQKKKLKINMPTFQLTSDWRVHWAWVIADSSYIKLTYKCRVLVLWSTTIILWVVSISVY